MTVFPVAYQPEVIERNISLKLKILHLYWYIILHNPVKRQLKVFDRLGMSFIELIWLLGKLRLLWQFRALRIKVHPK